jgi:hypothetical protein
MEARSIVILLISAIAIAVIIFVVVYEPPSQANCKEGNDCAKSCEKGSCARFCNNEVNLSKYDEFATFYNENFTGYFGNPCHSSSHVMDKNAESWILLEVNIL